VLQNGSGSNAHVQATEPLFFQDKKDKKKIGEIFQNT